MHDIKLTLGNETIDPAPVAPDPSAALAAAEAAVETAKQTVVEQTAPVFTPEEQAQIDEFADKIVQRQVDRRFGGCVVFANTVDIAKNVFHLERTFELTQIDAAQEC